MSKILEEEPHLPNLLLFVRALCGTALATQRLLKVIRGRTIVADPLHDNFPNFQIHHFAKHTLYFSRGDKKVTTSGVSYRISMAC